MRANTNLVRVQTFQFHKGAIETDKWLAPVSISANFQFHKGAIETLVNPSVYSDYLLSIP